MRETHFRVGNYVSGRDGHLNRITLVRDGNVLAKTVKELKVRNSMGMSEIKPIRMSEEWLNGFGFDKYGRIRTDESLIEVMSDSDGMWTVALYGQRRDNLTHAFLVQIEYVHQLQNLYFCLRGKDLQLNSETDNDK